MTPYTTKSGLQIGCRYDPPPVNHVSQEGEFWQGVLLGFKPNPSACQVIIFGAYCAFMTMIFAVIAVVFK
jgi:hypothetical protein